MKTLKKGIAQTIVLDQTGLGAGKTVKVSIVGENGSFVQDSAGDLKDITLAYNSASGKYEVTKTILSTTANQYIRLFFYATDATISENYYPEDAKLEEDFLAPAAEIIPVAYFNDYFLKLRSSLDAGYAEAVDSYLVDKNGVRNMLLSAQHDLEMDTELYISERTIEEKRDNYFEYFNGHFWQFNVNYPPITELLEFKIKFGANEIADIGLDLFIVSEDFGAIEFVPIATDSTSGLYTLLMHNLSGIGVSILTGGLYERIPNMFHVKYKTGLWSISNNLEKEGIRTAVARRAFIKLIDFLDPSGRVNSQSESIDGVSSSVSYNTDRLVERLNKEENKWIGNMKRKYGRDADIVVV